MKLDPDIHHSTRVVHAKESICCYVRAKVTFKACKNRQKEGRIESINCAAVMWNQKEPKQQFCILCLIMDYHICSETC